MGLEKNPSSEEMDVMLRIGNLSLPDDDREALIGPFNAWHKAGKAIERKMSSHDYLDLIPLTVVSL